MANAYSVHPRNYVEHPGLKQIVTTRKINYQDIQGIIDVSRPYYNLEDERVVTTRDALLPPPAAATDTVLESDSMADGEQVQVQEGEHQETISFTCTVKPEMPFCRETGSMASAEAGRHMAIAGSVAAALNNKKKGKHYYLALSNDISNIVLPDLSAVASATSSSTGSLAVMDNDTAVITAHCISINKREAVCKITMMIPGKKEVWHLVTTYSVIAEKLFKRRFAGKSQEQQHTLTASSSNYQDGDNLSSFSPLASSPYAKFQGLDPASFKCLDYSSRDGFLKMQSRIPKVPAHHCLGHFDSNQALPVAVLAAYSFDLVGYSISTLLKQDIPFRHRLGITLTSSSSSRSRAIVKKEKENHDIDALSCKLVNAKLEAKKLVFANTHGLNIFCEVTQNAGYPSLFSVELMLRSDDDDNEVIATVTSVWSTTHLTHGH
jgi:hypothetical protein